MLIPYNGGTEIWWRFGGMEVLADFDGKTFMDISERSEVCFAEYKARPETLNVSFPILEEYLPAIDGLNSQLKNVHFEIIGDKIAYMALKKDLFDYSVIYISQDEQPEKYWKILHRPLIRINLNPEYNERIRGYLSLIYAVLLRILSYKEHFTRGNPHIDLKCPLKDLLHLSCPGKYSYNGHSIYEGVLSIESFLLLDDLEHVNARSLSQFPTHSRQTDIIYLLTGGSNDSNLFYVEEVLCVSGKTYILRLKSFSEYSSAMRSIVARCSLYREEHLTFQIQHKNEVIYRRVS